jgi:oligoribonuclease (3'-5' exoribonuclease)
MKYEINANKIIEGANELAKLKINELEKISSALIRNAEKEITKIETWKSLEIRKIGLIEEVKGVTVSRLTDSVINAKFYFHKLNESLKLCGKEMINLSEYNQEATNILNDAEYKLNEYLSEHTVLKIQN